MCCKFQRIQDNVINEELEELGSESSLFKVFECKEEGDMTEELAGKILKKDAVARDSRKNK